MEGGHGVRESDRLGSGLAAPVSAPWVWSLVSESAVPWLSVEFVIGHWQWYDEGAYEGIYFSSWGKARFENNRF